MPQTVVDEISELKEHVTPIEPEDTMSEAGRKAMLRDFIRMLEHETGSRTGEDIEDVHQMRVATRRMRSAFQLLESYYKPKTAKGFRDELKQLASRLGKVRDLDVMIDDLLAYQARIETDQQEKIQEIIDRLDKRRAKARVKLNKYLDNRDYAEFKKRFSRFLTQSGKGAQSVSENGVIVPHQIRHVLPSLVYDHLAHVRAYDTVINEHTDYTTLHALRIEFKRLRYLLQFFDEILGSSIKDFIKELKTIQDYLGRLNDAAVAEEHLKELIEEEVTPDAASVLQPYIDELETSIPEKVASFPDVWAHFNTRTTQSLLSNALLVLR